MSFLAKFIIDGKDYNVLECVYSLKQPTDETGKPMGRPKGGQITLTVESEGNTDLFHWIKEPSLTKNGTVTFFKRDAMAQQLVLQFSKAFCVAFSERFIRHKRCNDYYYNHFCSIYKSRRCKFREPLGYRLML